MTKEEFKIEGMHCSGCASRIQRVLSQRREIKESAVDYKNQKPSLDLMKRKSPEKK